MSALDANTRRFIATEIERQLNVVLSGVAGETSADAQSEDVSQLWPGDTNKRTARPVMHPFGFVSRAVQGIISVVARQGAHPGNRITLGHRDAKRPADLEEGESAMYSAPGYRVYLRGTRVTIAKLGPDGKTVQEETAVVGDTLLAFLKLFLGFLENHTHVSTAPGAETTPPIQSPDMVQLGKDYLDNSQILASDTGRFATP